MEMQFGKNYRVVGLGEEDSFCQNKQDWAIGMVITPLTTNEAKAYKDPYLSLAATLYPENELQSVEGDSWVGAFRVVSVPDGTLELAEEQGVEPGNWISFCNVTLEEVE